MGFSYRRIIVLRLFVETEATSRLNSLTADLTIVSHKNELPTWHNNEDFTQVNSEWPVVAPTRWHVYCQFQSTMDERIYQIDLQTLLKPCIVKTNHLVIFHGVCIMIHDVDLH